jgi:hypothetical protein
VHKKKNKIKFLKQVKLLSGQKKNERARQKNHEEKQNFQNQEKKPIEASEEKPKKIQG